MKHGSHSSWQVHRRLYLWVLHWGYTPYALPALIAIAFAESSFFPVPPDILLIPLVAGMPSAWLRFAFCCTIASVLGGAAGYGIGVFAWETIGQWIVENLAHVELIEVMGREDIALPSYLIETFGSALGGEYLFQVYDHWNAWIVFVFGLTPLPYKLVTITAGVAKVNFPVFMLASLAARGVRFFAVAWLIHKWGGAASRFIDRYFNILCILFIILLIGGFVLLKFIF